MQKREDQTDGNLISYQINIKTVFCFFLSLFEYMDASRTYRKVRCIIKERKEQEKILFYKQDDVEVRETLTEYIFFIFFLKKKTKNK